MKKGIFERCRAANAGETARKVESELDLLKEEVLLALTGNGEVTDMDAVALLLILEPFVSSLHTIVVQNMRATLLLHLLRSKYDISSVSIKMEGDHYV